MLEQFGDNLTVTNSDISKLTHFPPENSGGKCVSYGKCVNFAVQSISSVPEGTIARISAIRLKLGWKSLLKRAKMDMY